MPRKVGRPTKYDPDRHPALAYEFCAQNGFTDKKLAKAFDVTEDTINRWKHDHPEFSESMTRGKDDWDSDKAEKSLAQLATGYRYTETVEELVDGQMVVTKKYRKHMPAQERACGRWLNNRRPDRWRDKRDMKLEGDLNINLIDSFKEEDG